LVNELCKAKHADASRTRNQLLLGTLPTFP
jgi:hypothetical protein